jgi:hypothetical protein
MWRIPVFLVAFAAGCFTVGIGSLWLGAVTVFWLGLVALVVGMAGLIPVMFHMLSWVVDGPKDEPT